MPLVVPTGLSDPQLAIWLEQQLFPGKPIYNTGQFLTIRGPLRFDLFETALRATVLESPGLRLPPRSRPPAFDLPVIDLRNAKDPTLAAEEWMQAEMRKAFALEDAALYRFALIRIADDCTLWFLKTHHIIIDATGRSLISARTAARYRALRFGEPLPALDAATPEELLEAERRYESSGQHQADRHYWLDSFKSWPGPLLEVSRQDSERGKSGRPARIAFKLKRADFARLDAKARAMGSSAARAITALTAVAFARLYDCSRIVLGIDLAFRPDARSQQTIGLRARALPMMLSVDRAMTIGDIVREVEAVRTQNYPHRHYSVLELVRELAITRKGQHGLFDVSVNFIPTTYDFAFENAPVELTNLSYGFPLPWMVTVADNSRRQDLDVTVETDQGLIPAETAQRLACAVETLLLRGLDDADCPIASLPVMPKEAQRQVLDFAEGERVAVPDTDTIASLCAAQAKRTPDAIALVCGERQFDFATLHARAERWARRLAALGVKPGVAVGIALPRGVDLIVAVLAVHKAGGAYLALDPSYPAERIHFIVDDAAAPVIMTTTELAPVFADSGAQLLLDTDQAAGAADLAEPVPARPDDLAYVLYTSGSTGRPKAVGIEHRNLVNLVYWGRSIVSTDELQGLLFSTSLNFDLSAFEMFLPLAFGGRMIVVENLLALAAAPHRDEVHLVNTGPSMYDALLRTGELPSGVTTVILCGEKLTRHLADLHFSAAPSTRLLNFYGPTETTVYSSWTPVDSLDRGDPTIGRALWNTTLYVLDSGRALVPVGAEGELYIGGAGVARGYLGRPELTAERFLPNPFGPGRIYRTGDRVRWRPDGEIEYLGRVDDQMKINGIRVEPGEIEAALLTLPDIDAAAVKLYDDAIGRRLVAYLVAAGGAAPTTSAVREAIEQLLPRNMVPAAFVWLKAMPMTPNGKLDRKALPAPQREAPQRTESRSPQTKVERELAEIWKEVLGISSVDVEADFFDLGGDSLALLNLFFAVEARLGKHLSLDILSEGLSIAKLAKILADENVQAVQADAAVALQPHGKLPPFFFVHGLVGGVLPLRYLAGHLGTDRPFFGLRQTPGAALPKSIGELAERYAAAMLKQQPSGPYYLGGHSFGATVAYEIARQLETQGHNIGLLAIIDQRKPGWRLTVHDAMPAMHRIISHIPGRIYAELKKAPGRERAQHIKRTLTRWSNLARGIRIDASMMFDANRFQKEQFSLIRANLAALQNYRPQPSAVPISLYRAEIAPLSHLALDSTLGWRDLTTGHIRVHVVPGDHESIAAEPRVHVLAQLLAADLDAAQGVSRRFERAAE